MSEYKLPEDIKKEWLNALSSGEYRKGEGSFYRETTNSYCCLGVLHDILLKKKGSNCSEYLEEIYGSQVLASKGSYGGYVFDDSSLEILEENHDDQMKWTIPLYTLNDSNETWEEVIEYIEKNL